MSKLEVSPKVDVAFKKLMTDNGDTTLLRKLVAGTLDVPKDSIGEIIVKNPEISPIDIGSKFCRLDVNTVIDGQQIDIEIQRNDLGDYKQRALYYWSTLFTSALPKGEEYSALPRTIIISIVDFDLFSASGEYHSEFVLKERKRGEILTDLQSLHFIELMKLPKELRIDREFEVLLKFLASETEEELQQFLNINDKDIEKAVERVKVYNADTSLKEQVRKREETLMNEVMALTAAKREGREEVVRAMKASGMTEEQIQRILSL